jgi:hypothetical protein
MSGQGGPIGWKADDTVVKEANVTVVISDSTVTVAVDTGTMEVTTISKKTGFPIST